MKMKNNHQPNTDSLHLRIVTLPESAWSALSEEEVWNRFRAGNQEALVYMYQHFHEALFRYAQQFRADPEAVKDSIQELFVQLHSTREKLGPTTSIKFYLFRSLRRLLAKESQFSKLWSREETLDGQAFDVVLSRESVLIEQEMGQDQQRRLQQAINKLPVRQKEAIYYFSTKIFLTNRLPKSWGLHK